MLIKFNQNQFVELMGYLKHLEEFYEGIKETNTQIGPHRIKIGDAATNAIRHNSKIKLPSLIKVCNELELKDSAESLEMVLKTIDRDDALEIKGKLKVISDQIHHHLNERYFFTLSPIDTVLYNKSDPFGEGVSIKFQSANNDISEATKCYVVGRYTACVFHSMRILESGLRIMATYVGLTDFGLENWKNITDQIEKQIRSKESLPKSSEKEEELQFLSEAAKEFTYFKNAWRNHVSHTKADYDSTEAAKIFNHVKDFMVRLSNKLKENNT